MAKKRISIMSPFALIAGVTTLMLLSKRVFQPRLNLTGSVVLITGGSRGLGLALAKEFAGHGAKLILCARDKQELEQAQAIFTQAGAEVMTIPCDLTNGIQVQSMLEQAKMRFGTIDILGNISYDNGVLTAHAFRQTRTDCEYKFHRWFSECAAFAHLL